MRAAEADWIATHLRDKSQYEVAALGITEDQLKAMMLGAHRKWVVYDKGLPAAVFGASNARRGVWTCFGFGTPGWDNVWRQVTVAAKKNMMDGIKKTGAHRVQCMSPASHDDTHKWLRFLGLTFEVDCPAYGASGEDFKMFAWIKG